MNNSQRLLVAITALSLSIIVIAAMSVSITPSTSGTYPYGQDITFNADVIGGIPPYTYIFSVYNSADKSELFDTFLFSNTFTWSFPPELVGSRIFANVTVYDSGINSSTSPNSGILTLGATSSTTTTSSLSTSSTSTIHTTTTSTTTGSTTSASTTIMPWPPYTTTSTSSTTTTSLSTISTTIPIRSPILTTPPRRIGSPAMAMPFSQYQPSWYSNGEEWEAVSNTTCYQCDISVNIAVTQGDTELVFYASGEDNGNAGYESINLPYGGSCTEEQYINNGNSDAGVWQCNGFSGDFTMSATGNPGNATVEVAVFPPGLVTGFNYYGSAGYNLDMAPGYQYWCALGMDWTSQYADTQMSSDYEATTAAGEAQIGHSQNDSNCGAFGTYDYGWAAVGVAVQSSSTLSPQQLLQQLNTGIGSTNANVTAINSILSNSISSSISSLATATAINFTNLGGSISTLSIQVASLTPVNVPTGVNYYIPFTINNGQPSGEPSGFQQMLSFNALAVCNAIICSSHLNNTEWFSQSGNVLASWYESGKGLANNYASNSLSHSGNVTAWVKLSSQLSAYGYTVVYLGFEANSINLFSNSLIGEAPQLTQSYGKYDTGNHIFNFYDNFHGTTLNTSKWYNYGLTVTVNNGIDIDTTHPGQNLRALYQNVGGLAVPFAFDTYMGNFTSSNGRAEPFIGTTAGNYYDGTASGLENSNYNQPDPDNLVYALAACVACWSSTGLANPYPNRAVFTGIVMASQVSVAVNYGSQVISTQPYIAEPFAGMASNYYSFNYLSHPFEQWIRIRDAPPGGIMPSVAVGSVTVPGSSCPTTANVPLYMTGCQVNLAYGQGLATNSANQLINTGSGGSIPYYFSTSQSNVTGYNSMLTVPFSPKTTLTSPTLSAGNTIIGNWITPETGLSFIPFGSYECHDHAAETTGNKNVQIFCTIIEVASNGMVINTIGTTELSPPLTTSESEFRIYYVTANTYTISPTSRIEVNVYADVSGGGSDPKVSQYIGGEADSHLSIPSSSGGGGGTSYTFNALSGLSTVGTLISIITDQNTIKTNSNTIWGANQLYSIGGGGGGTTLVLTPPAGNGDGDVGLIGLFGVIGIIGYLAVRQRLKGG